MKIVKQQKKDTVAIYNQVIRRLKREYKELTLHIAECIKTIEGFERLITNSLLFIRDRENLFSAYVSNVLPMSSSTVNFSIRRIPKWVKHVVTGDLYPLEEKETDFTALSQMTVENSKVLFDTIPEYIQNINRKLLYMTDQKRSVAESLRIALLHRNQLKRVKPEDIADYLNTAMLEES
jgi:hypothetical protein